MQTTVKRPKIRNSRHSKVNMDMNKAVTTDISQDETKAEEAKEEYSKDIKSRQ